MLESDEFHEYKHINIAGVMGMATFTTDLDQVRQEFRHLKHIFDKLKSIYFEDSATFREISMGMSGDYLVALQEGSTMVRIGSKLFAQV